MIDNAKKGNGVQEGFDNFLPTNLNFYGLIYTIIFLGIITFLLYANSFDNDWVWDDVSSVLIHKHVQDPRKIFQLFREDQHAFGRGQGNFYRPLVSVSFMIDFLLSYSPEYGKDEFGIPNVSPFIFHITNTVIHLFVISLVFLLLLKLKVPPPVAISTSLIYGIHPIHTEAVTYISGRADIMSALFILLSLIFALRYLEKEKIFNLSIVITIASFILGLLSKESTTIFPILLLVMIILYPLSNLTNNPRKSNVNKIALISVCFIVLGIYLILRSTILRFSSDTQSPVKLWSEKVIEVGQALAFYLRVMTVPINLHMEQTLENTPWWTSIIGYLFIVGLITTATWAFYKRNYRIVMGVAWFIVGWFPISGIFTLNAPQAEHWMYLPMIGFWWVLFELIFIYTSKLSSYERTKTYPVYSLTYILVGILAIPYSYLTIVRNDDWQNNETIFRNTLLHNPNSVRVRYNLAVTYEEVLKDYSSAVREYRELLKCYDKIKKKTLGEDKKVAFLGEEELEATLSLGKTFYLSGKFYESIQTLAPLSHLGKKKELLPYAMEALSIMSKSSIALGDIKSFQTLSVPLSSFEEERKKESILLILGGTLETPSYIGVN